jgi:hypothetical protein
MTERCDHTPKPERAPISAGCGSDWDAKGIVLRRAEFLATLRSPEIQRLLADAQLLMRSPQFPPKDPDELRF